jgi:small GTP-binding protein
MIQKKVCMIGSFGVGKTSLVARFVRSIFSEKYQTTVGVKIDKKILEVGDKQVTLVLWDIAGEDALTTVRPSQLRGASGYILVVDGLRRGTYETAIDLEKRVADAIGPVPFLCVFNKNDLRQSWEVTEADVEVLRQRGWSVILSSAKNGEGVEELFQQLTAAILKVPNVRDDSASEATPRGI